jgi:putative flippase GtrA
MGVLWLLVNQAFCALPLAVAKALATELAMVNNLVRNELWTFHADTMRVFVDSRSELCT